VMGGATVRPRMVRPRMVRRCHSLKQDSESQMGGKRFDALDKKIDLFGGQWDSQHRRSGSGQRRGGVGNGRDGTWQTGWKGRSRRSRDKRQSRRGRDKRLSRRGAACGRSGRQGLLVQVCASAICGQRDSCRRQQRRWGCRVWDSCKRHGQCLHRTCTLGNHPAGTLTVGDRVNRATARGQDGIWLTAALGLLSL
jgi:hypothetical protein